ncbi:hypothetical protein AVEN_241667-1 [Araneus ventricosus]|uniref:Uncharacterized protein n=1 Tax=Araneus ventricosus TaxID=182803 RepID=A0A4Y2MEV9_ARAVE|nr:hypothetical protein AVEN_241667-1 [Araneus ventricosus]
MARLVGILPTTVQKCEPRATRGLPSYTPWEWHDWSEFPRPQSKSANLEQLEVSQATCRGNGTTGRNPPTTFQMYEPRATRGLPSYTPWEWPDWAEFPRTQSKSTNLEQLDVCQATRRGNGTTGRNSQTAVQKYEPRATRGLPSHTPWEWHEWSEFPRPQSKSTNLERLEVCQATRRGNKALDVVLVICLWFQNYESRLKVVLVLVHSGMLMQLN